MALSMAATTTNIAGLKRTANVQSQSRRAMTVVARQTTSSRSETPMTTMDCEHPPTPQLNRCYLPACVIVTPPQSAIFTSAM